MAVRSAQASTKATAGASDPAPGGNALRIWIRAGAAVGFLLLLGAVWLWSPLRELLEVERLTRLVEPHRRAWYALPAVVAAFVLLNHLLFPLTVLVLVTGMVFGPWLGSIYGLAGALGSAATSFALGRALGARGVERLAGARARRFGKAVGDNGVLATFLIRKVPAPYALVNLVVGASPIRFVDFMLGTLLGVGLLVVVLSILGHQALETWHDPSPAAFAKAAGLLALSLLTAVLLDRVMRRRRRERSA